MRSSKACGSVILVLISASAAIASGRGFRTQDLLRDHFAKYGHEFGKISQSEYLHMAQLLRDSRPGKSVLEAKRADGGASKFDTKRGWYVDYDADGTIRTFFVPKDGVRYFERRLGGAGPPEK